MPPLPLPKLISLTPFIPDPTAPTFTDTFNEVMGNIGTPADGFDSIFTEMAALSDSAIAISDLDPSDLAALDNALASLASLDSGPLVATLAPAEAATSASLGVYNQTVPPTATNPGGVGPTPTPTPTPKPPACPIPTDGSASNLGTVTVGDTVQGIFIDSMDTGACVIDPGSIRVLMVCSTGAFSILKTTARTGICKGGAANTTTWTLEVDTSTAGTFNCTVSDEDTSTLSGPTLSSFVITIKPKA